MLRSLKETGINARLTQSTYEAYKDETSAIAKKLGNIFGKRTSF